jgi:hypothetical protein
MIHDLPWRLRNAGGFVTSEDLNAAADEIERLRQGGCARDQRTTQFCAEAVALQELIEGIRWSIRNAERDLTEMREERDAVRRKFCEMCASVGGVYRRVGRENVECRTAEEIAEICGWDCYKEPVSKSYKSNSTPPA